MALFKADRLCLLCSYRSIEWKQFGKVNKAGEINAKTHQKTNSGLICSKCDKFVCIRCIKMILPAMSSDSHQFLSTDLLDHYQSALSMPIRSVSTLGNYIGHCCSIGIDSTPPVSSDAISNIIQSDNHPSSTYQNCPSAMSTPPEITTNTEIKVGRLSGCIFFPEFELFIDSPLDCMDIHAVGPEHRYESNRLKRGSTGDPSLERKKVCFLPARWHCVISHEEALRVNELAPQSNSKTLPISWTTKLLHKIKINLPHNSSKKKVSIYIFVIEIVVCHISSENNSFFVILKLLNIRLIKIVRNKSFCLERKASNIPTDEELHDSYLFKNRGPFKKKVDVTLILGMDSETSSVASILLCRFHTMPCSLTHKQKEDLLSSVWQSMKANKFECRRRGGSSGLISSDKNNVIKKFISYPGCAPRNGSGVIWMQGTDTWYLYYIGTFDGKVKRCHYTNPVPGGSFRFNHKFIKKHKILADFISIKPIAALIIEAIQGKLQESEEFNTSITPQAIRAELMNIAETRDVMNSTSPGSLPLDLKPVPKGIKKMNKWLQFYSIYNRDHVKFTMVVHPVGFHLDSFKDKCPSLENKFCVEMLQHRITQRMIMNTHPYGRGHDGAKRQIVFSSL